MGLSFGFCHSGAEFGGVRCLIDESLGRRWDAGSAEINGYLAHVLLWLFEWKALNRGLSPGYRTEGIFETAWMMMSSFNSDA